MKIERGYPTYTVTPKAENAIVKGHPWVYDAEILNIEGETANGGLVDVISRAAIWAPVFCPSSPRSVCGSSPEMPTTALTKPFGGGNCNGRGTTGSPSWTRRIWTPAG